MDVDSRLKGRPGLTPREVPTAKVLASPEPTRLLDGGDGGRVPGSWPWLSSAPNTLRLPTEGIGGDLRIDPSLPPFPPSRPFCFRSGLIMVALLLLVVTVPVRPAIAAVAVAAATAFSNDVFEFFDLLA